MATYDDELMDSLKESDFSVRIINDAEYYFDLLNNRYPIIGTQIQWSKLGVFYKNLDQELIVDDFDRCIEEIKRICPFVIGTSTVIYLGDSLTELAYEFEFRRVSFFFERVSEIPQSHYFIDYRADWCISVNMTNDLNFGYSELLRI